MEYIQMLNESRKANGNLPGMGGLFNHVNHNLYHYAGNNPIIYTDPTGMWVDNEDGTFTAEEGDTLHGLYGDDWQEKSGFTRDPTTLQVGETVGKKNTSKQNDVPAGVSSSKELQSNAYYRSIVGAGIALVGGGNVEVGYVWDSLGNKGIALSGDLGCGVSAEINLGFLRPLGNMLLNNLISNVQSYTCIDGTIYDFEGSYATAKVHAIGGLTTDLNNTDDTNFSLELSVGGGAFLGVTKVFGF